MTQAKAAVDHLVVAAPELAAGVDYVASLLGLRATAGGRHPRWGTHNAIVALDSQIYIEIIAADPERDRPETVTLFGLDEMAAPRLVTWAAKAKNLERSIADARANGVDPGEIIDGTRERPDGSRLSWRLTDPHRMHAGGLVPFLIDWLDSVHPASSSGPAGRLQELSAHHPDPAQANALLAGLGLSMPIARGETVRLSALIRIGGRLVELV